MKCIFLFLMSLVFSGYTHASPCDNPRVAFEELDYLGKKIRDYDVTASGRCVVAYNDIDAAKACGTRVVNPENSQYKDGGLASDPTKNPAGYYYCAGNFNKETECNGRTAAGYTFVWSKLNRKNTTDGYCKCGPVGGSPNQFRDCAQVSSFMGPPEPTANSKDEVKDEETAKTETPFDINGVECLNDLKNYTVQCSSKSDVAEKKCDAKNPETEKTDYLKGATTIISGLGAIMQAKGKMIGAAETCLRGGLISATGYSAYNMLKEDCSKERSLCNDSCASADAEYKNIQKKCAGEVSGENLNLVLQKAAEYKTQYSDSWDKTCKVKAGNGAANLTKLLSDLNQAGIDSAKCNCQLTAGGAANYNLPGTSINACSNVQGPAVCLTNPSLPGCSTTIPIAGCAGENSKTKTCACALDPNGSQCGNNSGGGSQLAGPGQNFNGISTGGSNFKTTGGGGSGGLDGLNDSTGAHPMAVNHGNTNADSPFAAAAGGGGGGSGSGSGGGSENSGTGGTAGDEPKSGMSGVFGNLKSAFQNALGLGGSAQSKTKNFSEKKKNEIDPNAWSPKKGIRGLAGDSALGGKNKNIFDTIANRYSEEYHTLMTIPTPAGPM
jgi:hypothetical protein